MAIDWATIDKVLGSKATENTLGIVGALLKGKAEGDAANDQLALARQNQAQNASEFRANLLATLAAQDDARRLNEATNAIAASPLGQNENYLTRNRINRALLPALFNAERVTPGDPAVAAVMPHGGPDLRGVVTPEMLAALSDEASGAAIANRAKMVANIDSTVPTPDFKALGLDPALGQAVEQYAQGRNKEETDNRASTRDLIMRALAEDYAGEQQQHGPNGPAPEGYEYDKKTGQLKKKGGNIFGKILGIGANIALPFVTGGLSLPAQLAIGAGLGAGTSLLSGGGLQGALTGAAMGAGNGLLGAKIPVGKIRKPGVYDTDI